MGNVVGLVLPFFGLILLGYLVAKITRQPLEALGWMNTFIIYLALPALFFNLLARTPVEQLTQWRFIVGATFGTYIVFSLMFVLAVLRSRGNIAESTIKGLAAAYGNIGYMGPGLALLAFGEEAVVPVALIFCFDNTLHFVMAPLMMALSGKDGSRQSPLQLAAGVIRRVFLHPFILATILGVAAAIFSFQPPPPAQTLLNYLANAAAPCALFAMGVTLALRPLRRVPSDMIFIVAIKLFVHPVVVYVLLSWLGDFPAVWIFSAVLLAALPSATNVFVIAQQYGVWVERASASVLLTTAASVISVTALLYAMKNGLLSPDLFP
ncbi:AEC family transporter [Oricola cellulosilytica]|uniref:AEC family transporter n=1 Tax=Oricola cellulosilytica TaxID=1429082 RepID=A0A4R0P817_9HYPH|nr:AEC family transporter [Oricola cellulosilytica]TCD13180.1 AEC family transporter [Oricola cellulosilytica]